MTKINQVASNLRNGATAFSQSIFFPNLKVHPKQKWRDELADFGSVEFINVSRNGKKLSAILVKSKSTQLVRGTVVLAHPISKKAKFFFNEGARLKFYLDEGYQVVLFDFNGFGESERIDFFYWHDTKAILEWVKSCFPNQPLILHGLSFGSFHVIRALNSLPTNSGVVFENTNRSLYDYWKRSFHTGMLVRLLQFLPIQSFREMDVVTSISNLDRRDLKVLFVACENDIHTPSEEMRELASHLKNRYEFLLINGAKHFEAPTHGKAQYYDAIKNLMGQL